MQLGSKVVIGGDDECFEFVDRRGPSPHCASSSNGVHSQGFALTLMGPWRVQPLASQDFVNVTTDSSRNVKDRFFEFVTQPTARAIADTLPETSAPLASTSSPGR